jgi:hypothetical protein
MAPAMGDDAPASPAPRAAPCSPAEARRARRVLWLTLAVIIMSAVDLSLTLTYVTTTGMVEVNPLARHVMSLNSPALLAAWKAATLGFGLSILVRFRHARAGEAGAWVAAAALLALMVHWVRYNNHLEHAAPDLHLSGMMDSEAYVSMTREP